MFTPEIRVGIDIGSRCHRVAMAAPDGRVLEEFDLAHTGAGFEEFFRRVRFQERQLVVAMEGFNGHARPLDSRIQDQMLPAPVSTAPSCRSPSG